MIKAVLTIDDIASANTPKIVDYLCEKNICAVMFAVGENVEKYYDEAVYALKKGMIVGNHSYSHPAFSSISLEQGIEEIEKNEEVLNKLYEAAGVERIYKPFRFPYGDKGGANHDALQLYLKQNNFTKLKDTQITYSWYSENKLNTDVDTFWTFDFAEYQMHSDKTFTKESVYARINDKQPQTGAALLKDGSSHIILLHAHDETENLVPEYYKQFLDYVIEHGVTFDRPEWEKTSAADISKMAGWYQSIKSKNELEFVIFCIENIAIELGVSGEKIYEALTAKSDILNSYIVPNYDILHTQGKEYIVNDILEIMSEKGVSL